ncbi:MAG: O-antigen ligase family protein [Lentisphaeria bacterium]|nr:O-antigen ligase family protein [Lentisphaeria bacterium]
MKYLFFGAAIAGIAPAVMLMICDRRWVRWFTLGLTLPLIVFNASAINFLSHETYRGTSRGMEISIIYITALSLLLGMTLLGKRIRLITDTGCLLYLFYFLFSIPSLLNAENCLFSFFELWKMFMIYLVFLAVFHYLEYSQGDFDIILYGFAAVIFINFLVILQQHLHGIYQVRGVFPHQNSMAMCMMMAGMLFFARIFNNREGFRTKIFIAVFLVASVSLVRTYSRGALFCYPLAGMLTMGCSFIKGFSSRKIILTGLLVLCGFVGLLLFLPKIIYRFENAPKSSGETRKNFAIAALNMIRDKPLAGVGLNNWGIKINPPYEYSRHRDPKKGYTEDFKDGIVETIYLLVGAECGIPCLLVLLTWFGYYWFTCIRLMRRLRGSRYFYIPSGVFGALSGAFLQSTLEWILKQQINFMWLMILFAFISYLNRHGRELMKLEHNPTEVKAS